MMGVSPSEYLGAQKANKADFFILMGCCAAKSTLDNAS
jgi:hypothetical protein